MLENSKTVSSLESSLLDERRYVGEFFRLLFPHSRRPSKGQTESATQQGKTDTEQTRSLGLHQPLGTPRADTGMAGRVHPVSARFTTAAEFG